MSLTVDDMWRGRCVRWLHTPRGGYGFTISIPATVVRRSKERVTIEVQKADGTKCLRVVNLRNLRNPREGGR